MGADGFLAYFGCRWDVTDQNEISLLEARDDPRMKAAQRVGLKHWWGVTPEEGRYFLLIGAEIGNLGWEGQENLSLSESDLTNLISETKSKLAVAGFSEEPAIHLQFEPDY